MGICVIEFSVFITNHNLRATQSVETVVCVRVCVDRRPMYAHVFIITRYIRIALFGLYIYIHTTHVSIPYNATFYYVTFHTHFKAHTSNPAQIAVIYMQ